MKVIINKKSVRTGSRMWFSRLVWECQRCSWNQYNPDVVVIKSTSNSETIVFVEDLAGNWYLYPELTTCSRIGDALENDLEMFVNQNIESLTTDNQIKLNIGIK